MKKEHKTVNNHLLSNVCSRKEDDKYSSVSTTGEFSV